MSTVATTLPTHGIGWVCESELHGPTVNPWDPVDGAGTTGRRRTHLLHGLRMTTAVNGLGLPAVAVPVGIGEGLPQAVQVIGPRYAKTCAWLPPRPSRPASEPSHR